MLKAVRAAAGLTQRELGELADVNAVYICQIETGQNKVGHRAGIKLWRALRPHFEAIGLTLEDFLDGAS